MLATLPDGKKADEGAAIGAAAAATMIASRVGDGRNDASVVYAKPAAPGIWQPATGGVMALAWLGFVDPIVDVPAVALDGPDALTSGAYAVDYNEVRLLGSTTSADRTAEQTTVARFFSANPVLTYRDALCRHLDAEPLGLLPVTRMFARIDGANANSFIQTWLLKFDDAFHARIWGGLHFRDATDDGYLMGHTTADRVMRAIRRHPSAGQASLEYETSCLRSMPKEVATARAACLR